MGSVGGVRDTPKPTIFSGKVSGERTDVKEKEAVKAMALSNGCGTRNRKPGIMREVMAEILALAED